MQTFLLLMKFNICHRCEMMFRTLETLGKTFFKEAKLVASSLGQSNTLKEKRSRSFMAEEHFKINIFYKSLDSLLVELSQRFKVVDMIALRFEFMINPPSDPSAEKIQEQGKCLRDCYPNLALLHAILRRNFAILSSFFTFWGYHQKEIEL